MVNKILLIETNFTSQLWRQFLSNKAQSHEAVSLCEFSSQAELRKEQTHEMSVFYEQRQSTRSEKGELRTMLK